MRSQVFSASAGTFAARAAALIRTFLLAVALGAGAGADAYNVANQLPNQVYLLLGGGVLAGLFVPRIAEAYARGTQVGDKFGSALFNWTIAAAATISIALLVAGGQIIAVMAESGWSQEQVRDATRLFYWFAPQILGIAAFSIIGQVLNCRDRFAVVEWLSCISSVWVSLGCILVLVARQGDKVMVAGASLGIGTTLAVSSLFGICAQAASLVVALKMTNFRFHFIFRVKKHRLVGLGKFAFFVVIAGACFQVSNMLVASVTAGIGDTISGRGYSAFVYAIAVSFGVQSVVVSAASSMLLARVSRLRSLGDLEDATSTFNRYMRNLLSVVLPISGCMVVSGPELGKILFGYGEMVGDASHYAGLAISAFGVGLVPSSLNVLFMRQLFAYSDGRHVLTSALNINIVWIATIGASFALAPMHLTVLFICLGLSVGYWYDVPWCIRWIRRGAGRYGDHVRTNGFVSIFGLWLVSVVISIVLRRGVASAFGEWVVGSPLLLVIECCGYGGVYWLLTGNHQLGVRALIGMARRAL